ncbi:hypothetical protein BAUCODRAFT_145081 [Baudoinia panamericana UAMH 10762]|uniref:Uncharacterized protein n=1 Tax=Baudoinia panamericana (strain UAMH 10762) TaxID=717646 RepID=M2LYB4_BAUPA|nr:uncharacterized protein BAUCODRAFT_145081 [Baudoinia panamericana UAMH 10762]EMC99697.1 hypothetical protein BAUCODRAFT_145081 [Baudoinia panamericana UAMH 10762]
MTAITDNVGDDFEVVASPAEDSTSSARSVDAALPSLIFKPAAPTTSAKHTIQARDDTPMARCNLQLHTIKLLETIIIYLFFSRPVTLALAAALAFFLPPYYNIPGYHVFPAELVTAIKQQVHKLLEWLRAESILLNDFVIAAKAQRRYVTSMQPSYGNCELLVLTLRADQDLTSTTS